LLLNLTNTWNRLVYILWAPVYDALIRLHPVESVRHEALEHAGASDAERVLLVGVGTGADLPHLPQSSLLAGLDLSMAMLRAARRKAKFLCRRFVAVRGDAECLPFRDGEFDLVILTLVVTVVPHPQACVREAMRVVRPGGNVLVLDKFVTAGTSPSVLRRCLGCLSRLFGTTINLNWEEVSYGLPDPIYDPTIHGCLEVRTIILRKPPTSKCS